MIPARAYPRLRGSLLSREPAAFHSKWRIGGLLERFYRPADLEDLCNLLAALAGKEAIAWLGSGRNLLVRDSGFKGSLVDLGFLTRLSQSQLGIVRAEAAVSLPKLLRFCAQQGYTETAVMLGSNHSLGGALTAALRIQDYSLWAHVTAVEVVTTHGDALRLPAKDFLTDGIKSEAAILAAEFRFPQIDPATTQRELADNLGMLFKKPAGHGPVFAPVAGVELNTVFRDCGIKEIHHDRAVFANNFIKLDGPALVSSVEWLLDAVARKVAANMNLKLSAEINFIGGATA